MTNKYVSFKDGNEPRQRFANIFVSQIINCYRTICNYIFDNTVYFPRVPKMFRLCIFSRFTVGVSFVSTLLLFPLCKLKSMIQCNNNANIHGLKMSIKVTTVIGDAIPQASMLC